MEHTSPWTRRRAGRALTATAAFLAIAGLAAAGSTQGATTSSTRHLEYVFSDGEMNVYDIDRGNRFVRRLDLPNVAGIRGAGASPPTGRLYIAYGTPGSSTGSGSLLAYDLIHDRVIWRRNYASVFGPTATLDSFAITPNGKTIYMPLGEGSGTGTWAVLDAATGRLTGSIAAGLGAHDTAMGLDGTQVYLGGVEYPYLEVASTASNKVVKKIGPLHGPGVRPFTINGSQTLAFTTARSYLGFQVSSIKTGKVLYSVAPPGFTFDPRTFTRTPDHGISLSPDERELYLIDTPNGYVHVFDVRGLPGRRPRDVADIKLAHPPPHDGWLQHSRSGRYVYVGRAGDIIDTRTRTIVSYLAPLGATADFVEIDWRNGKPVSTTSRVGRGYVVRRS